MNEVTINLIKKKVNKYNKELSTLSQSWIHGRHVPTYLCLPLRA